MEVTGGEETRRGELTDPKTTTDPTAETRRGPDCMVGLECFLDVVRALGMGSCLSLDGSAAAYGSVPSSHNKRRRRRVAAISSPSSTTPSADNVEMWLHRVHDKMFLRKFEGLGKWGVCVCLCSGWEGELRRDGGRTGEETEERERMRENRRIERERE